MKILNLSISALIMLILFSCVNTNEEQTNDKIIGVKIYSYDKDFDSLVTEWKEIGINTAFASKELASNTNFRKATSEKGIKVFVILPIFFNSEALAKDSSLYAITNKGNIAKAEWVEFVCPTQIDYRNEKVKEIAAFVKKFKPDGISIDFIRNFLYWEKVKPQTEAKDIEHGCYCQNCLHSFFAENEVKLADSLKETEQISEWILTNKAEEWANWKEKQITSMIESIVREVKKESPKTKVNLHIVPWRKEDYNAARKYFAAQDLSKLAKLTDYVSPMCYSFMLYRESEWINAVVQDLNTEAGNKVLPSIQVMESYRSDELTEKKFEEDLKAALLPPSKGVLFWEWKHFDKVPAKKEIVKEMIDKQ